MGSCYHKPMVGALPSHASTSAEMPPETQRVDQKQNIAADPQCTLPAPTSTSTQTQGSAPASARYPFESQLSPVTGGAFGTEFPVISRPETQRVDPNIAIPASVVSVVTCNSNFHPVHPVKSLHIDCYMM